MARNEEGSDYIFLLIVATFMVATGNFTYFNKKYRSRYSSLRKFKYTFCKMGRSISFWSSSFSNNLYVFWRILLSYCLFNYAFYSKTAMENAKVFFIF